MASRVFYAVAKGKRVGIYNTWVDCKKFVDGYGGAVFKKFGTEREAERFIKNYQQHGSSKSNVEKLRPVEQRSANAREDSSKETFYAVKSSNPSVPNKIFKDWQACSQYVSGKRGLSFKKFATSSEATKFVAGSLDPKLLVQRLDTTARDFDQRHTLQAEHDSEESAALRSKTVSVFCDGSSLGNGTSLAAAGYGVYFQDYSHYEQISEPLTKGEPTNNRAELKAVLEALLKIWNSIKKNEPVPLFHIFTDSELVARLINDEAVVLTDQQLRARTNGDLIVPLVHVHQKVQRFYDINESFYKDSSSGASRKLRIEWVKGHSDSVGNTIADELARNGAAKSQFLIRGAELQDSVPCSKDQTSQIPN